MMALLTLGGLEFDDFEIPGQLRFGGAQRLAVHRLIGGARVIDAMGRDDSTVTWSGVFVGGAAAGRARTLDAMRASGNTLTLAWDAFAYSVVIDQFDLEFCNPWWIPYRISCTVLLDLAQGLVEYSVDLATSILNDLTSASAFVNVAPALTATSVADALTPGNADNAAAAVALGKASASISQSMATAQQGLASTDLATLVSSSGSLAQLSVAQGYVNRSLKNLNGAGT
jgi:hypothetical protein